MRSIVPISWTLADAEWAQWKGDTTRARKLMWILAKQIVHEEIQETKHGTS